MVELIVPPFADPAQQWERLTDDEKKNLGVAALTLAAAVIALQSDPSPTATPLSRASEAATSIATDFIVELYETLDEPVLTPAMSQWGWDQCQRCGFVDYEPSDDGCCEGAGVDEGLCHPCRAGAQ